MTTALAEAIERRTFSNEMREVDHDTHFVAYAVLNNVKAFGDGDVTLTGMATTPAPDRMGDIIEPEGASYSNPLPLLWQHDSDSPVGTVRLGKSTNEGIPFTAKIPNVEEPGPLKDRIDTARGEVKLGLVRAVSIGFRALDWEIMKNGGIRWTEIEILELSLVTIPANAEAIIQTVKSYGTSASAQPRTDTARVDPPLAAGAGKPVKAIQHTGGKMSKYAEQIRQFEATLAAKSTERDEMMDAAAAKGETLDAAQEEQYETLKADIATISKHIVRLREQEAAAATKAKPVDGSTAATATQSRSTSVTVVHEKPEPGIRFARFAMALCAAKGNTAQALNLMQTHYPQELPAITVLRSAVSVGREVGQYIADLAEMRTKAAVAAHDTQDATSASPLVAYNEFAGDFIEYLRPRTIIGQLGPRLRNIPFNTHIKGQTSGGTGYWVGEGGAKPVTAYDFSDAYHQWTKVAAITVQTEELMRFSNPSSERLLRDALGGSLIERIDSDVVDPTITATAGVRPASLTNGVTPETASGTTAAALRTDVKAVLAPMLAANLPLTDLVIVTTPALALSISLMQNALGQPEFPGMSITGGTLLGLPVIVSNYVDEGNIIFIAASEIYLSDDNIVTIDASREASIQMLDNPTNSPIGSTVATSMVSMFQTDSIALRGHRYIHWSKRRSTAVQFIDGAAYA